jgi:hypothetical protein
MVNSLVCAIQILVSQSVSSDGKLDIAGGPSFHHFDTPISDIDPWLPGFNLDFGVAVSGETARAKAPKRWKNKIPKDGELVIRPWWLTLVPRQVVLSPGGNLSTVGLVWELLGISSGVSLGNAASIKVGVELPEIEWLAAWGPQARTASNFWIVGVSPDAHLQVDPASWLRMDLGWAHHLGVPLGEFKLVQGDYKPWSWGSAYFQLHLRPGISI